MSGVLQKIPKIHAQLVPPQNAVMRGTTPDGKQLWYEEIPMSRSVPRIIPGSVTPENPKGVQEWKKNLAGEGIYPLRQREDYIWRRLYFLESQGNNNVQKVDYVPKTEEQLAAEEKARMVEAMEHALPAALVEAGLTAADLPRILQAGQAQVPVEVDEPEAVEPVAAPVVTETTAEVEDVAEPEAVVEAPVVEPEEKPIHYPVPTGGGWWKLSDGTKIQGKKSKAVKAERLAKKAVLEARAEAAGKPSF